MKVKLWGKMMRKFHSNYLFPVSIVFLVTCSSVSDNPQSLYEAGLEAGRNGDRETAYQKFERAVQLDPGHLEAQLELVSLHMDRDEPDHAVAHLTKLLQHFDEEGKPPPADIYLRRGRIYYQVENYDKAIRDTTRALEKNPGLTEALNIRGLSRVAQGEYTEARDDFWASLDVQDNAQAFLGLAIIRIRYGQWREANEFINRAIETNDKFARAFLYRAAVHREQNRTEKMREDLKTYLQLHNPDASIEEIRRELEQLSQKTRKKEEG